MANEPKSPVETTSKVNAYVTNLIDALKADNLNLSVKDKVDIGGLLDNMRKRIEEYMKELKASLPLDNAHKELVTPTTKVSYSERTTLDVTPEAFEKEVSHDNFLLCVKVNLTKAKTFVTEERLKEIGTSTIQPIIAFKLR